jgi:hypothetical protein
MSGQFLHTEKREPKLFLNPAHGSRRIRGGGCVQEVHFQCLMCNRVQGGSRPRAVQQLTDSRCTHHSSFWDTSYNILHYRQTFGRQTAVQQWQIMQWSSLSGVAPPSRRARRHLPHQRHVCWHHPPLFGFLLTQWWGSTPQKGEGVFTFSGRNFIPFHL